MNHYSMEGKEKKSTPSINSKADATDFCFIRLKEVLVICAKSRSSVYESIQKGTFPAPVKLGGRSSAWIKAEVLAWAENCIKTSRDSSADDKSTRQKKVVRSRVNERCEY